MTKREIPNERISQQAQQEEIFTGGNGENGENGGEGNCFGDDKVLGASFAPAANLPQTWDSPFPPLSPVQSF